MNYVNATNLTGVTYTIGSASEIVSPGWSMFLSSCGSLTFNLTVNQASYTTVPNIIQSFNISDGSFSISDSVLTDAGTYSLNLSASGGTPLFTNYSVFTLTILNPCTEVLITPSFSQYNMSYEINGIKASNYLGFSLNETLPSVCGSMVYAL